MADLYPPSYSPRSPPYRPQDSTPQQQYTQHHTQHTQQQPQMAYQSPQLVQTQHSGSSSNSSDDVHDPAGNQENKPGTDHSQGKTETKPQATFLTKLYAFVLSLARSRGVSHASNP